MLRPEPKSHHVKEGLQSQSQSQDVESEKYVLMEGIRSAIVVTEILTCLIDGRPAYGLPVMKCAWIQDAMRSL